MGMTAGGKGGIKSDINVTPLVDVVLVLLIIFMVITPLVQVGYDTKVPPKVEGNTTPPPATDQIIIRMEPDGRIFINKEEVAEHDFPNRLRDVLKNRESKVTFFAAAGELPYDRVMTFMDMCRNAGAQNIGIVLDELSS